MTTISKIRAAILALAQNATHPKFITEALAEIEAEFDALKKRVEDLENGTGKTGAQVDEARSHAEAAVRAAQAASVAANQAALEAKAATQPAAPAPAAVFTDPAPPAPPAPDAPPVPPVTA